MPSEISIDLSGYLHPAYAASLSDFGTPRYLSHSGTWVLTRPIPGTPYHDAMGLYPITCCPCWAKLRLDMDDLRDLVSFVFVADPFGNYAPGDLGFLDTFYPFKSHYYIDTTASDKPCSHHVRAAKRARGKVNVVTLPHPHDALDDWVALYDSLIEHREIEGITRFSRGAFDLQLRVPGVFALQALRDGHACSMVVFYVQGEVAYYHLGASSPEGYEVGASHALFHAAIDALKPKVHYISLGGGAGLEEDLTDGLTRFKRGWAALSKPSWLCGAILRPSLYWELCGLAQGNYFPLYRDPRLQHELKGGMR